MIGSRTLERTKNRNGAEDSVVSTSRVGVWVVPVLAFAAVGLAAFPVGSPVSPASWGTRGPFGAFTWTAWFVSSGLAMTLLLLAFAAFARRGTKAGGASGARLAPSALAFGLLALLSYVAAASAEWVQRNPARAGDRDHRHRRLVRGELVPASSTSALTLADLRARAVIGGLGLS